MKKKNILLWFIYIACRCLEGSKSVIVSYMSSQENHKKYYG